MAVNSSSTPANDNHIPARPLNRLRKLKSSSSSNAQQQQHYSEIELRAIVDRILYPTAVEDPVTNTPLFILNSTALPSPRDVSYNLLLPHLLDVVAGLDYSIVFFAGGAVHRPTWAWMIHTYSSLDRDIRKRLKRLYIVHENWWVRTIMEMVAGAVSGKFRKKAVHIQNLSVLAQHLDIRFLSIPLAVYVHDRKLEPAIEFDSPHGALFEQDLPSGDVVPLFWRECIAHLAVEGLYTEGVFRVSPRAEDLGILREAFDRCQLVNLHDYSPHVVASSLKLFLRLLPTAPLPFEIMSELPDFQPSKEYTVQAAALLPLQTVALFSLLVPLLRDIALHERSTRMSVLNLARSITPSLIRVSIAGEEIYAESVQSDMTLARTETRVISDPAEMALVLDYFIKIFECLIYYWTDLPFVQQCADSISAEDDGDDGKSRTSFLSRNSSSSTLKSLSSLPPPLPLRKYSVSGSGHTPAKPTSGEQVVAQMQQEQLERAVQAADSLSAASDEYSAGSPPSLPSSASSMFSEPSEMKMDEDEDAEDDLDEQADEQKQEPVKFSYSVKTSKKVEKQLVTPSLRTKQLSNVQSATKMATKRPTFESATEADKPYIPIPTSSPFMPLSATTANVSTSSGSTRDPSARSASMPLSSSKRPAISVVGGFRCISADSSTKHAEVLRSFSPYVSTPATPASLLHKASSSSLRSGKENVMVPPPLPAKIKIPRKSSISDGSSSLVARKKGRIVEELTKIFEERSQSAELLLAMDRELQARSSRVEEEV
ncbi:uncharacterized protein V2V93DRAFT_376057 [Kockiozyma suomiensis]|uniref:uncharacterized protein n=1 Tax=Kockiozyma suomiensis TaxID=1337062 RepID=UPI0033436604